MKNIVRKILALVFLSGVFALSPAMAGKLTIENKNCTTFLAGDYVKVHIWDTQFPNSGDDMVWDRPCSSHGGLKIGKGKTRTIDLVDVAVMDLKKSSSRKHSCHYKHEAHGTVDGKRDVSGSRESSRVICEKQGVICQCRKHGL